MDMDQFAKRLDWLDEERRKDKAAISVLEQRLAGLEGSISLLKEQNKTLSSDLARIASTSARVDQFEAVIAQYRTEIGKVIEELEKRRGKQEAEGDKRRRVEIDHINKSIAEIHKSLEAQLEMRKQIQARIEEEGRLARAITETERRFEDVIHAEDEIKRAQRILDENRKQDVKRLADIQGEVAAVRKRLDDTREKADLNSDTIKLLDTRINELMATETERRQAQVAFVEQQSLAQVERDRTWKEWQARFDSFYKQASALEAQLQALEELQRSVKRSQDTFDDLNQRIERRINEITEMQRLADERFHQEWVTFKADDQKRWTNYSISQEELNKEIRQNLDKLSERIAALNDTSQTQSDLLQQTTETTEKQMQDLMNWAHEWLSNYERIMGRSRIK